MKKEVIILTPYVGDGTQESPYAPLIDDVTGPCAWEDITARPMQNGKPLRNLYAIKAWLTDKQITAVLGDARMFVSAKPAPAYRASDVDQWLKNRGFDDHPVKSEDTEERAIEKLRGYLSRLPT